MPNRALVASTLLTLRLASCAPLPRVVPDLALRSAHAVAIETRAARPRRACERIIEPAAAMQQHPRPPSGDEAALTDRPLVTGNQVTLLEDRAATYRAMLDAIAGARRHIDMET
jgi:cardiolipin synthase